MGRTPSFGIYVYGWYDAEKWQHHRHALAPQIGFYDCSDARVVDWQVEQLAKTGVDYVVFEMVPPIDHSFALCAAYYGMWIDRLKGKGIGYSFLIDLFLPAPGDGYVALYRDTIAELSRRGWLDELHDFGGTGRRIFAFAPFPHHMQELQAATPGGIRFMGAIWNQTWDRIVPGDYEPDVVRMLGSYWAPALAGDLSFADAMEPLGYFQFWQNTKQTLALNGFTGVAPGYDDTMLQRRPVLALTLERRDGHTLVEQFRAAAASGAHDIIIYSWNEYFETSGIEPTVDQGDFYLELTRRLIAQVKAGQPIAFPPDLPPPRRVAPIYLGEDLERSGRLYPDGIPRWGFDDHRAELDVPEAAALDERAARFAAVKVRNSGVKDWHVASAGEPIRLGARLRNAESQVVREGRAALGTEDVASGAVVRCDLEVETAGLPPGRYEAEIGVVWEGRKWFAGTRMVPLTL